MIAKLTAFSRPIVILAALALLMDLLLTWRAAPVVTQYLDLSGGVSALHGWGVLAAGLLMAFIVAQLVVPKLRRVVLGLAVAASAATVLAFFTVSAAVVKVDGDTIAAVESTLWPAYLGLALAGILVVAAVRRLVEPEKEPLALPPFRTEWKADAS